MRGLVRFVLFCFLSLLVTKFATSVVEKRGYMRNAEIQALPFLSGLCVSQSVCLFVLCKSRVGTRPALGLICLAGVLRSR